MSKSEFTISVETHRASKSDPMDKDEFGILEVTLDGSNISKAITAQQDAILREALEKIFWSLPRRENFD
jgi:hypothetical protein